MRPEVRYYVAMDVERVSNLPEPRTVFALVAAVLGLAGVALFGISIVEVWGGIWSAIGFVVCVAVVAVSGFDLAPLALRGSVSSERDRV